MLKQPGAPGTAGMFTSTQQLFVPPLCRTGVLGTQLCWVRRGDALGKRHDDYNGKN